MQKLKRLVIDGHNLIPKVPGLRLEDDDDEERLSTMVNEYCRLSRSQAEVFFDGAPSPGKAPRNSGLVRVHFVRKGLTADDAIINYVRQHQQPDHLLTVISSDHHVQNATRGFGATVITSEVFSQQMQAIFSSPAATQEQEQRPLSEQEVLQWLDEFKNRQNR
jgi:predicted RNA-binding protein with PIN domain